MATPDDFELIAPFLQLPTPYYFMIMVYLIPVIGSIASGLILPRIVAPLFIKTKGAVWRGYQNAYLETGQNAYSLRRWLSRSLLVSLLIIGLIAVVINAVDPLTFITQAQYNDFSSIPVNPQYVPPVTISLAGLIAPIAFGLWAVSWSLEDAGLVQYKLPKEKSKGFYEVEPTHARFGSYLKGYAGLSSVIFMAVLFMGVIADWLNAVFILLMPLFSIIQTIPAYLVYARVSKSYLRKGVKMAKYLEGDDILAAE